MRLDPSTTLVGAWYEATKMTIRAAKAVKYMMVTSWRRRFFLKIFIVLMMDLNQRRCSGAIYCLVLRVFLSFCSQKWSGDHSRKVVRQVCSAVYSLFSFRSTKGLRSFCGRWGCADKRGIKTVCNPQSTRKRWNERKLHCNSWLHLSHLYVCKLARIQKFSSKLPLPKQVSLAANII